MEQRKEDKLPWRYVQKQIFHIKRRGKRPLVILSIG